MKHIFNVMSPEEKMKFIEDKVRAMECKLISKMKGKYLVSS